MKSPKKLPKTVIDLSHLRQPENALSAYLDGHLDYDELHSDEQEMYNRYMRLTAVILDRKGRFNRKEVLSDHEKTFGISPATAQRDLSFVNKRMALLLEAEMELHKLALYNEAWEGIRIAKQNDDAKGVALNVKAAKEILGIGHESQNAAISEKIEQHINVFIADDTTKDVMLKILEKNISVHEYNMTLEEILEKEQELQKTLDIPHEEI